MEKTHDYIHPYRGYWGPDTPGGRCRIRVYEKGDQLPVVIVTDLPANVNASITNMAEFLAAETIQLHFSERFGREHAVLWIEQHPRTERDKRIWHMPEYAMVAFDSYERQLVPGWAAPRARIGRASWRLVSDEEVEQILGCKPT